MDELKGSKALRNSKLVELSKTHDCSAKEKPTACFLANVRGFSFDMKFVFNSASSSLVSKKYCKECSLQCAYLALLEEGSD